MHYTLIIAGGAVFFYRYLIGESSAEAFAGNCLVVGAVGAFFVFVDLLCDN